MKHISELLTARKQELEERRQMSLFSAQPAEKGSAEWSAFSAVRGDRANGYAVRMPKKPIVVKEPQYVLRIIYPYRELRA